MATVTGNIKSLTGGALTTGTVQFVLTAFYNNLPRVIGNNIILPTQLTVSTDGSGNFTATVQGNDTIDPAGTLYAVTFFNGGVAMGPFLFNIGGLAVDLNTQAVVTTSTPPAVPANILGTNNTWTGTNSFNGAVTFNSTVNMALIKLPEIAAPAGSPLFDVLFGASSGHRASMINNNGTADVIVGAATTDTLTNKTISATTNTLTAAGAVTGHVLRFNGTKYVDAALAAADLADGTTGTGLIVLQTNPTIIGPTISTILNGGTLTLPSGTDTLVARATVDTLTNKTMSSMVVTGSTTGSGVQGTDAKLLTTDGSGSTGDSWCRDASGGATSCGPQQIIKGAKTNSPCNTGGGSNSACQDTLTWAGGAFSGTPTYVVCQGQTTAQFIGQSTTNQAASLVVDSWSASQVIVTTETMRSLAAQFSSISCIGML